MNPNRLISLSIAAIYLVVAYASSGTEPAFKLGMFLILPLACIWFSEAMGGYTGPAPSMSITKESPGIFVCILGWVLLLFPVILMVVN